MSWPWPSPVDHGGAQHLTPGIAMPDIALPATTGEGISPARIAGRAVLFCYPWTGRPGLSNPPDWDNIPGAHGSTPEVEGFRDLHTSFQKADVAVFGLSMQSPEDQQEFAQRLQLPFAIFSDAGGAFQQALALPVFETGGVRYLKRLTLVLRDGAIERVFYPVHPPDRHAHEALAYVSGGAT